MNIEKQELPKSQYELKIELSWEEFRPYVDKGAKIVSEQVKIDGFRPGSAPYDVLKRKVGEMSILEEAARQAINSKLAEIIKKEVEKEAVGQPSIEIVKLAPENPFVFKVILSLLPEIKISEYKGLKLKEKAVQLDEAEFKKTMNDLREMQTQEVLVDRAIKDQDKATVDIRMFLDNVPIEGGQAAATAVVIGRDYIIPGFDKQLLGLKRGESKEFSLPYPKEHHMKNLAGKMVEFKVTIKDVYERKLPELNDDFAQRLGLKKISELEETIKKNILEQKSKESAQKAERAMLDALLEKTKFGDIPPSLIEHETHTMIHELADTVEQQGGKFEDYLASINKTEAQLTLDLMPDAVKRVKVTLLIREIAQLEKISASPAEVDKNIADMKKYYESPLSKELDPKQKQDILSRLSSPEYRRYVENVMNSQAVVKALREWNIEK